jgi:hypothetical protein
MSELSDRELDFIVEGLDDWIGLWRFALVARDERPDATAEEIREQTLPMLRRLVIGEYMRPGALTEDAPGFVPWDESGEEALTRIDREWRALGRDPNIPDICWFENTQHGDQVARELLQARSRRSRSGEADTSAS